MGSMMKDKLNVKKWKIRYNDFLLRLQMMEIHSAFLYRYERFELIIANMECILGIIRKYEQVKDDEMLTGFKV